MHRRTTRSLVAPKRWSPPRSTSTAGPRSWPCTTARSRARARTSITSPSAPRASGLSTPSATAERSRSPSRCSEAPRSRSGDAISASSSTASSNKSRSSIPSRPRSRPPCRCAAPSVLCGATYRSRCSTAGHCRSASMPMGRSLTRRRRVRPPTLITAARACRAKRHCGRRTGVRSRQHRARESRTSRRHRLPASVRPQRSARGHRARLRRRARPRGPRE